MRTTASNRPAPYHEEPMKGFSWDRALEANFGRFGVHVRGSIVDRYFSRPRAEAEVQAYILRGHPARLVDSKEAP